MPADETPFNSLHISQERDIAAPPEIVFQALLDQLGPLSETSPTTPLPMVLEPWPGGRWFRDLGNNTGHFWGHIQVIKPPLLLELCGPMFMSYPAISHVQYRLNANGGRTYLRLTHKAMGLITQDHRDGIGSGWDHELNQLQKLAEERVPPSS